MRRTVNRRFEGILAALCCAAFTGACASSGGPHAAAVPRPFPVPSDARHDAPSRAPESAARAAAPDDTPAAATATAPATRGTLVDTALALRGTPYRLGGADPAGFDCSGFTQYVFGRHGLTIPRAVHEQFLSGKTLKSADIAPGDLLFFAATPTRRGGATHVALALGDGAFVHAPSSTGVVRVEHLTAAYWADRYLGARRLQP